LLVFSSKADCLKSGTIDLTGEAGGRISSNLFCRQMEFQANFASETAILSKNQRTRRQYHLLSGFSDGKVILKTSVTKTLRVNSKQNAFNRYFRVNLCDPNSSEISAKEDS